MKPKESKWTSGKNPADTKPEYPEKFGKAASGPGRLRKGGVKADYPEGHCLGPFKGQRAGAKRKGDNRIMIGYPDAPMAGNGHPGAHQA
jgi:hypothetical protein